MIRKKMKQAIASIYVILNRMARQDSLKRWQIPKGYFYGPLTSHASFLPLLILLISGPKEVGGGSSSSTTIEAQYWLLILQTNKNFFFSFSALFLLLIFYQWYA